MEHYLAALARVLGSTEKDIVLHEPCFAGNEWEYVKSCIDSGWVSSLGEYVSTFENKLAEYTGLPYVIAAVNGTAALHVSLVLAQVKANDEVLIPSLTFVATANAVAYCQAIPHFIDAHPLNLGVDIEKLEAYLTEVAFVKENLCFNKKTGRRIKAIIPVHIYGHPVEMEALQALAHRFHLTVIEDASESLGSFYKGKHTGYFSDLAVFSFNGNKIITTGGGGAIVTKNPELARHAKHLTTTAKRAHRWEFYHDEVGYNYRLPNINAALGCAQLEQLPQMVENKRRLAQKYIEAFKSIKEAKILQEPPDSKSNYWLNALILNQPDRQSVEQLIEKAAERKYGLRGLWTPLHTLPMYQSCPRMDLLATERLYASVVALPSSARLGVQDA